MKLSTCNDFEKIVIEEVPLIDVRAPIEYEKGTFKNATNLPIMYDEERHWVGTCYKEKGNKEAVELGYQLVSGQVKEERIKAWINHLEKYPDSRLCCFRGGLRSQIAQQWIAEATGKEIVRLEGGYKAFRNYLISELEPEQLISKPVIIGGFTGSGKTTLLKNLPDGIDLEGIANHRGSAFGRQLTPQPTPINFENNLAYALIQHKHKVYPLMILEDEGTHVGKCYLPKSLAAYFAEADLVILKVPFEERVQITTDEYVYQSQHSFKEHYPEEQWFSEWAGYIQDSLSHLMNRLGGDRYKKIRDLFDQACTEQQDSGSCSLHQRWIAMLLHEYYDPMYQYQIQKNKNRIIFEGNRAEILSYLENKGQPTG